MSMMSFVIVLLNEYMNEVNHQNLHIWNSHHQHAARLFRTTRTISSFSATAGLLVPFPRDKCPLSHSHEHPYTVLSLFHGYEGTVRHIQQKTRTLPYGNGCVQSGSVPLAFCSPVPIDPTAVCTSIYHPIPNLTLK